MRSLSASGSLGTWIWNTGAQRLDLVVSAVQESGEWKDVEKEPF